MKLETYVNGFAIAKGERQQTTAEVGDVLNGKTYITGEGSLETGEMTNNAAFNIELEPGETQNIPQGYHNGQGKVTALESEKLKEGNIAYYGAGTAFGMNSNWTNEYGATSYNLSNWPINDKTNQWIGKLNEDYLSLAGDVWQTYFKVKVTGTYYIQWYRTIGANYEVGIRVLKNDTEVAKGSLIRPTENGERFLEWSGELKEGDIISLEAMTKGGSNTTHDNIAIFVSK